MDAKHTPGPWTFGEMLNGQGRIPDLNVYAADDMIVARVFPSEGEGNPNAALIAAAPELKDELINLVNTIRELKNIGRITDGEFVNITQPAQMIIAKAEGR